MSRVPLALALVGLLLQAGCGGLLPYQRTYAINEWDGFEEALEAFEAIEVGRTTWGDLSSLGFNPYENDNVDLLTYVQVYREFVPNRGVDLEDVHPAIRGCVAAREGCVAVVARPFYEAADSVGSFWLNFLRFRTETEVDGWVLESLVVLVDDVVTMKIHRGHPRVAAYQDLVRPLGPLQDSEPDVKINFP